MKKNGFTIIELLVSITLIAAISVAVGVGVSTMLRNQKNQEYAEYKNNITSAACVYADISNLRNNCSDKNNCEKTVNTNTLISSGLLSENLKNPNTGNTIGNTNLTITIKWINSQKSCIYPEE